MELKSRTTINFDKELYSEFEGHIRDLAFRRDAYLNSVLVGEIALLKDQPANSERGLRLWSSLRKIDGLELKKVSLRLDAVLLDEINRVCAEKGVPRDIFFDQFLRYVNNSLGMALVHIENPSSAGSGLTEEDAPYASLIVSDKRIDSLCQELLDDMKRNAAEE